MKQSLANDQTDALLAGKTVPEVAKTSYTFIVSKSKTMKCDRKRPNERGVSTKGKFGLDDFVQ